MDHTELYGAEQFPVAMPGGDLTQVIGTDDEQYLRSGILAAKLADRIDGVGGSLPPYLAPVQRAAFQAFKRLICHELTKSILVQSKGSVQLDWDEKFGTDVKFCHAHTDDDKKAQYEEQRQDREARTAGGTRIAGMRDKIKKYRR